MAGIFNLIWSWLESGYNCAMNGAKWIWAETKAIFKTAMDAFSSIGKKVQAYFSYSRERSWEGKNGSGRDRLDVRIGVSNEESSQQGPCLPSDPEESVKQMKEMKDTSTALKSLFEGLAKLFGKVEKLMNDDGQHNQRETDEKLRQLNQEEETQEMLKRLEEMKEVNQILC